MRTSHNRFMSRLMGFACLMSAEGAAAGGSGTDVDETGAVELMAKYKKKGKVVSLASDNQEDFIAFVGMIGDGNYTDWSDGVDSEIFTGLAMVQTEGLGNRLIAIANEEAALGTGGDPAVRARLYKMYVNTVVNAAEDNDAVQSQFVTVGGCFKQKFDLEAFNFQAKAFVKMLKEGNLRGITKKALQLSFQSAAFAKSQFPRITEDMWNTFIGIAEENATKNGYNTSIFDHWKSTRAVATSDESELDLNLEAFKHDLLGEAETVSA